MLPAPIIPPFHPICLPSKTIQAKLTKYFNLLPSRRPLPPNCTPKPTPQVHSMLPSHKRNAIRQKLLTYHLRPPQGQSIKKFTPTLPKYELLETWGHSLPPKDPSITFRVFLQNLNGLSLTYNGLSLWNNLHICHEYGPAAVCLPETNVNWNLPEQASSFKQHYDVLGGAPPQLSPALPRISFPSSNLAAPPLSYVKTGYLG